MQLGRTRRQVARDPGEPRRLRHKLNHLLPVTLRKGVEVGHMGALAVGIRTSESFSEETHAKVLSNAATSFLSTDSYFVKEIGLGIRSSRIKLNGSKGP